MAQVMDTHGNVRDLTKEDQAKAANKIREAIVGRTIMDFQELEIPEGVDNPMGFDAPFILLKLDEERALGIFAMAVMIIGPDMNTDVSDMNTPLFTPTKAH